MRALAGAGGGGDAGGDAFGGAAAASRASQDFFASLTGALLDKALSLLRPAGAEYSSRPPPSPRCLEALVPPLCYAVAALMGRLQTASAAGALPPGLLPAPQGGKGEDSSAALVPRLGPTEFESVLKGLVDALLAADRIDRARLPLYTALFSFLLSARPPRVTGRGLKAILEGRGAAEGKRGGGENNYYKRGRGMALSFYNCFSSRR